MFKKVKKEDGFTLVELIAVIAVIAILASVMMPKFNTFRESAYKSNALTIAKHVQMMTEAYRAENNIYPTAIQLREMAGKEIPVVADCKISDTTISKTNPEKNGSFSVELKAKNGKWYKVTYDAETYEYKKLDGADSFTITVAQVKS